MRKVAPWLLTFIVCAPNVLSGVETVNALTQDKKEETKISDVKFSKDAIHSEEKMDLSFKIEKSKDSPLERSYHIPNDIEHSLIPTKEKYSIKDKDKEVGEIHFKKDKMLVQWKENTNQQNIQTDCTLEVKAHYYNDEEEINKVKIGKEVTKILPKVEPLKDKNLLIQDIHYQPLEQKKENQVVLDLQWPVTTELKEGNQYTFELPKWMEAKKEEISFKDDDKKNWFEAKIQKDQLTLKILKGKVYDSTIYRLPIVFRVNANQNEKVVQWMKHAIPLKKKSVAMDDIDTAAVDTTKETKEDHEQSSTPESVHSSTKEKTRSFSLTSDSAEDATSTTTTDIQDAIILSHQEVKEGATEQEEIKIRTAQELLQKDRRMREEKDVEIHSEKIKTRSFHFPTIQPRRSLNASNLVDSIYIHPSECLNGENVRIEVKFSEKHLNQIHSGDTLTIQLPREADGYLEGYTKHESLVNQYGEYMGTLDVSSSEARITFTNTEFKYHIYGSLFFECKGINTNPDPNGSTTHLNTNFGIPHAGNHTISITKQEEDTSGKSPTFYYKSGMMGTDNPGRVKWGLLGNMNQDYIKGKMYIKDYVQSGQKIDWDSFNVQFMMKNPYPYPPTQYAISMQEFEQRGLGKLIKLSDSSFEIVLNENPYAPGDIYWQGKYEPFYWNYMSGVTFIIGYETIVTNSKQKYFDNKSEIYADYRTPEGDHSNHWDKDSYNDYRVKNIFSGGNIDSDRINVRIHKVDDKHREKKLSDAEFTLTNKKNHQQFIGITNSEGVIDFENVPIGDYTLQETRTPKGYKENKTIYDVEITENGVKFKKKYSNILVKDGYEFTVTNTKKKKEAIGPKLPNTGGDGYKTWLILVSCTLILGTMVLYIYKKKGTHTQ